MHPDQISPQVDLISNFFTEGFQNQKDSHANPKVSDSKNLNLRANLIIRKVLIQMISTLQIMQMYVDLKKSEVSHDTPSDSPIFPPCNSSQCQNEISNHNLSILKLILDPESLDKQKSLKFKIDKELLTLDLHRLIEKLSLSQVSLYVLLTNLYMTGKESSRVVSLLEGTQIRVDIKANEQALFYKSKRKDELVKFSFKFIRKHILGRFRRSLEAQGTRLKSRENKRKFDSVYFGPNLKAKNYFYSMEVNKKNLPHLKQSPEVVGLIKEYVKDGFLADQINSNIFNKNNNIFREDLTLVDFIRKIFVVQNKNNFTLQNILNSLYVFRHFFVFK